MGFAFSNFYSLSIALMSACQREKTWVSSPWFALLGCGLWHMLLINLSTFLLYLESASESFSPQLTAYHLLPVRQIGQNEFSLSFQIRKVALPQSLLMPLFLIMYFLQTVTLTMLTVIGSALSLGNMYTVLPGLLLKKSNNILNEEGDTSDWTVIITEANY